MAWGNKMKFILKFSLVLFLLLFTILFNVGLIDIRFSEIDYLLGKISARDNISNTYSIVAKYELIKRRMLKGEEEDSNYELEAQIQALTSETAFLDGKSAFNKKVYLIPVKMALYPIRLTLGKQIISPEDDDKVFEILEIAYFWERIRKYKEALVLYDEVLSVSSITPRIHAAILIHKAFCYSMLSNYDEAKRIYETVIATFPETDEGILAWKLLDFIQYMEKERVTLEKIKTSEMEKGQQFYLLMDFRNAIKSYSLFLAQNSGQGNQSIAEARYYKGRAHEELGEYDEAILEYRIVMDIDKTGKWAKQANRRMLMLGEFYVQQKNIADEARRKLDAYQDLVFAKNVDKYKDILTENSIKAEISSHSVTPNDSILKIIDLIGSMEMPEEEAEIPKPPVVAKKIVQSKDTLSESQERELKRRELLVQNPYRKPMALRSVIEQHQNEVKYIYNKFLRSGVKISGKMILKMQIRSDGGIESTEIVQSNLGDRKFEDEIMQKVRTWKFMAVADSLGNLTINYPFEFDDDGM